MQPPYTTQQTQQAVLSLNKPENPYAYTAAGNTVVGTWDLAASAQGVVSTSAVQKHYAITVTLDEATHTYQYSEEQVDNSSSLGIASGQVSHEVSKGKFVHKQFGMANLLTLSKSQAPAAQYSFNFDTLKVKQPLLDALAQAGWKKKAGFFGRLFGK